MSRTIPAIEELKQYPNWIAWRVETRNDKSTKIPVNPQTGGRAMSNNASTWGTYQQAKARYMKGGCAGLGFVFTKDVGVVGVDLDDKPTPVFNDDGTLSEWAKHITETLGSYTEKSPSGNGLHVLVKANIEKAIGSKKSNGVEMYDTGRWFTITGDTIVGTPTELNENQSGIDAIYEQYQTKPKEYHSTGVQVSAENISDKQLLAFVDSLLKNVRDAGDGEKHYWLNKISYVMGGYVAGGYFSEYDADSWLRAAIETHSTVADFDAAYKTIASALRDGQSQPLYLEQREQPAPQITVTSELSTAKLTPEQKQQEQSAIERIKRAEYLRGYHDGLTEGQRMAWERHLDASLIDLFQLGYCEQCVDVDTGEITTDGALTVPYVNDAGDIWNIEYRRADGDVRYELDSTPPIYSLTGEIDERPAVVFTDNIDAIVGAVNYSTIEPSFLGGDRCQFLGLPHMKLTGDTIEALEQCSELFVVVPNDFDAAGRGLGLLKHHARFLRLPLTVQDMARYGLSMSAFERMLKTAKALG